MITSDVTPIPHNRGPEYRLVAEEKNLAQKKPEYRFVAEEENLAQKKPHQILVGILYTCSPDPRPTLAAGSAGGPHLRQQEAHILILS